LGAAHAGRALLRAGELGHAAIEAWREAGRQLANGDQVNRVAHLAMKRGKSVDFTGYWQRHIEE
jgi:hypothetical protein